jgi:hypothetical protein
MESDHQHPAAAGKFDAFEEFNTERPQGPGDEMPCPDPGSLHPALYRHSGAHYPFHDRTVMVTSCGRLCLYRKKIHLSKSLAGQAVGVQEVDTGIWLVSFMDYDPGYVDLEERTLQPLAPEEGSGDHEFAGDLRVVFEKCFLRRQICGRRLNLPGDVGHARHERMLARRGALPVIRKQLPGILTAGCRIERGRLPRSIVHADFD